MLVEVLLRLPSKSILEFRCVRKAWDRVASGEFFQRRMRLCLKHLYFPHLNSLDTLEEAELVRDKRVCVLAANSGRSNNLLTRPHFRYLNCADRLSIAHACNGLLLGKFFDVWEFVYVVINPVNRSWIELPSPPYYDLARLRLAFDPRISDHFKVTFFRPSNSPGTLQLTIYSPELGERVISNKAPLGPCKSISFRSHTVFLNGALHMEASRNHVIRYDFYDETFQT